MIYRQHLTDTMVSLVLGEKINSLPHFCAITFAPIIYHFSLCYDKSEGYGFTQLFHFHTPLTHIIQPVKSAITC